MDRFIGKSIHIYGMASTTLVEVVLRSMTKALNDDITTSKSLEWLVLDLEVCE